MKFLRILILLTLAAGVSRADEENVTTLKFSDPAQPGRLRVVISNGDLQIRGADVDVVTIRTTAKRDDRESPRSDGLRVISTSAQFSAVEENNVITLEYGQFGRGGGADFEVTVPRSTALQLQSNFGGDIDVQELTGDVEIKNMNGEITLRELGGGALVETMNGEIEASFRQLPADKPLAFTSMNGEIKLRVPADAKANVRFRTQNGSILTDFPPEVLVTKTDGSTNAYAPVAADVARVAAEAARQAVEVGRAVAEEVRSAIEQEHHAIEGSSDVRPPRPPRAPRPPSIPSMAGGKVVSGTLNGGGSEIQIATMNGDIVVRKLER